ncbi:MAG: phoR 2 [Sphingobacteriaceae bacterium]|nr:phoR 2 [Sphingobacteriaceae bacterium]
MDPLRPYNDLIKEADELRQQLEEATDTIEAIRNGQVDALIVKDGDDHQLYTLKTADQTYRVFIEKMNEGAITLDQEGLILYSNTKFSEMVGLPLEKIIGVPFESFISKPFKKNYKQLLKTAWTKETKEEVELLVGNKFTIPCLLSCNTLELDEGIALSIIITDLTIHKENQLQLRLQNEQLKAAQNSFKKLNEELEETVKERTKDLSLSREHFKLLADHIPQMTWTNLPSGEINFYNQQWFDYTGLDFEQTKGMGWQSVIHPDDLDQTVNSYKYALKTGANFEVQNRFRRKDGAYRWHLNRAIPLKNEADKIVFWVGTATDIEDQTRAMEKRDEFIGIASHELKTPLTSLKGYLQIMGAYKKEPVPLAIKQYIEKANTAINKLQHLVSDLLDVSKIQAGRLDYGMELLDFSRLMRDYIENARHIYPDYDFTCHCEDGLYINGNSERLEQVFMNLVSNAAKYSQGSKKITINLFSKDDHAKVAITDFGIGLSDEQKHLIFDRFYRVEDKKYLTSGLGMGLYICSEIVKAHHGALGVDSQLGEGSTFYFMLPLVQP